MTVNVQITEVQELKPRITVFGIGGAGGNAVNNMIESGLVGCDFVVANTDAQVLASSKTDRIVQMGATVTEGLGAGSRPEVGMAAAEEVIDEINDYLSGAHMVFITAGMGGGTGTGAAPVIARAAREQGILTVGVVTKPFQFEGGRRMRVAEEGIRELQNSVDTLIVIPNQNLFRIANAQTTFAEAFKTADEVLKSGVACITDLMVKEGLINLDFADVRSVMRDMGKAMMGTGESSTDKRATDAAEIAIANPLLDETTMKGARGLLISITGGNDLTLFEVDEAATRIRDEVDPEANVILGATYDESMDGYIRVSVVATGIDSAIQSEHGDDFQDDSGQSRWPLGSGATVVPLQNAAARPSTPRAAWETDRAADPVPASTDPDVQIRTYRARENLTNSDSSVNMGNAPDPLAMSDMDRHGKQIVQGEAEIQQGYRAPAHEGYVPPASKQMPDASLRVSQSFFDPSAQASQLDKTDDDRRPRGLLKRITDNLQRQNFAGEYADGEPVDSRERRESSAVNRPVINRPTINRPAVNGPAIADPVSQATVPAPARRDGQPERSRPNHSARSDIPAQSGMTGMVEDTVESSRPSGGQLNLQPRAMDNFDDDQLEIPAFLRRENG